MTEFTDKELGKILADVEYLKKEQSEIKSELKEMNKTINSILNTLSEAKGHWKALLLFGTFCSVIGGLATKLLTSLRIW